MSGTAHEGRLGEGALCELLGEEHRRRHASECEAGQQVARRAGGTDAVHDGERPAERGERRQANVSGSVHEHHVGCELRRAERLPQGPGAREARDRKSTRLNSSHPSISYAVFCLKKKKKIINNTLHKKKNKIQEKK